MSLKPRQRITLGGLAGLLAIGVVVYLLLPRYDVSLSRDDEKSRAEILSHVPIGSPPDFARRTMEDSDFDCYLITVDNDGKRALRCIRNRTLWPLVGWIVVFDLGADGVTEVWVHYTVTAAFP